MKYLITGGYGLIGSNITSKLDGEITIVSRSDKHKARLTNTPHKLLLKDIKKLTKADLVDIDIIYHTASTVDNYHILTDSHIDVETNINGTIHILDLCKHLKKKPKIVYFSTFFVYGNEYEKSKEPITEESKTDPLALYPATKLCTENIIKTYSHIFDIPYLIVRLTNVYGEMEDYDNKKKGALNWLIMQAVQGNDLSIYKGGNFYRDYIHVDDVAQAVISLQNKVNDTYLIGYGEPIRFKKLIEYILLYTNHQSKVTEIEPPEFHKHVGITNFVADTSKIQSTGWKPTITPKMGIERVVKRYQSLI